MASHDELLGRWNDHKIVLVSHGGTNSIVSNYLGFPRHGSCFDFGYTSITRIGPGYTDRFIVRSLNEMAHLHTAPRQPRPTASALTDRPPQPWSPRS